MKSTRKIIEIDEERCNGCGECVTGCAEGALQIIDGKAKVVKEQFCDGLGDCIGTCPTGALKIIEREAETYDPEATREHVRRSLGEEAAKRFDETERIHAKKLAGEPPAFSGCPGMQVRTGRKDDSESPIAPTSSGTQQVIRSDLEQWPIQLHLVQPSMPFFNGRELVVLSTCAPVTSPDVHWRFVRGRSVVVACPKLDRTEGYEEKLAAIMAENDIPKVVVVRMTVPCCGGLGMIVRRAHAACGRTNLVVEEVTIDLDGNLVKTEIIAQ